MCQEIQRFGFDDNLVVFHMQGQLQEYSNSKIFKRLLYILNELFNKKKWGYH